MNTEWININDKLPNVGFYLATIKSDVDKWVEIVGYNGKTFDLPGRGTTNFVTHWAEIPKPA